MNSWKAIHIKKGHIRRENYIKKGKSIYKERKERTQNWEKRYEALLNQAWFVLVTELLLIKPSWY